MVRLVASLLLLLATLGCVKFYRGPIVEPPDVPFDGIAAQLRNSDVVRVVFVHGMCRHKKKTWIDDGWAPEIERALDANLRASAAVPLDSRSEFVIERRTFTAGVKKVEAAFILWSAATDPGRMSLAYDRPLGDPGGEYPWVRAWVNNKVKQGLINDCFSDAVTYAGHRQNYLLEQMQAAICDALDDCAPTAPTMFVTESLGSKMVFDAVATMPASTSDRLLGRTAQFFMLANQLPLLNLAVPHSSVVIKPSEVSFAERWAVVRPAAKLELVAFSDPNDLLSYRLREDDFPASAGVGVRNVVISNAGTFPGLIENPGPAHTGYENNSRVMQLILCGYRKDDCERIRRASRTTTP